MTCRDEVLAAFERLERRHGRREHELLDVVQEVLGSTDYKESTVRTHITSWMCAQAPINQGSDDVDLERVGRGRYRRRR
jgi:hypothetical protein